MRKVSLGYVLIALFLISCGKTGDAPSSAAPAGSKYGVKAGMSEMTMEMMGMKTTVVNYWDDFGKKSVTAVSGEMMGSKMNETTIEKDGYSIKYDGEKKTGTKAKKDTAFEDISFHEMTDAQMKERGMTEAGTETILGKECKVYDVDMDKMTGETAADQQMKVKGKVWVWNGIPMKMVMGDLMKMETTKLEVMESVPAEKFEVPADITLSDGSLNAPEFHDPAMEGTPEDVHKPESQGNSK